MNRLEQAINRFNEQREILEEKIEEFDTVREIFTPVLNIIETDPRERYQNIMTFTVESAMQNPDDPEKWTADLQTWNEQEEERTTTRMIEAEIGIVEQIEKAYTRYPGMDSLIDLATAYQAPILDMTLPWEERAGAI